MVLFLNVIFIPEDLGVFSKGVMFDLLERLYRNTVAESSSPGWFTQRT